MINADKPHLWKVDRDASVDMFNDWFMVAAPKAFREQRALTAAAVAEALDLLGDMRSITPMVLRSYPQILATLRMSTAPPIARDRLSGLAHIPRGMVKAMEMERRIPRYRGANNVDVYLASVCAVITKLVDDDVFPWLAGSVLPTEQARGRASTIVADRLTGSLADPIIRNAQEHRQRALIEAFLLERGYRRQVHPKSRLITDMEPGTFAFTLDVFAGLEEANKLPMDVAIQPKVLRPDRLPIFIEAKSAGDFANPNKRRKEEAQKVHQIRHFFGEHTQLILFLCGYFDTTYLGYEAAEGMDWIWEHRMDDLLQLGIDA